MHKFLLIDENIPDVSQFMGCIRDDVVVYKVNPYDIPDEIVAEIETDASVSVNIGFAWDTYRIEYIPFWRDLSDTKDPGVGYPYKFKSFLSRIGETRILTLDLITCDLRSPQFQYYTRELEEDVSGLSIRYSIDKTGNPDKGGDWILESHNVNIRDVWFKDSIREYHHLLGLVDHEFSNIFTIINGKLYGAGRNIYGTLGLGNTTFQNGFTEITTLPAGDVEFVSSSTITFVKMKSGEVYACGDYRPSTAQGQGYGVAGFSDRTTLTLLGSTIDSDIDEIYTNYWYTIARTTAGEYYYSGRLGNDVGFTSTTNSTDFTLISHLVDINVDPTLLGIRKLKAVQGYTLVLCENGDLIGWGINLFGELNQGNTTAYRNGPYVIIDTGNEIDDFYIGELGFATFIKYSDGSVKCCGSNDQGKLGLSSATGSFTTLQDHPITDINAVVVARYNTYFLKNDGTLYGAGDNAYGQLNDGGTTDRNDLVEIATDVMSVQALQRGVIYIKNDGTVGAHGNVNTTAFSTMAVSSNDPGTTGSLPYVLDQEGVTIEAIQQFGNFSEDFTLLPPQVYLPINSRIYIPVPENKIGNLFRIENNLPVINEVVFKSMIEKCLNTVDNSKVNVLEGDLVPFGSLVDDIQTMFYNSLSNTFYSFVESNLFDVSNNSSLRRLLELRTNAELRRGIQSVFSSGNITITNDIDKLTLDPFTVGGNIRLAPTENMGFTLTIKDLSSVKINIANAHTFEGELQITDILDVSKYETNSTGLGVSGDTLNIEINIVDSGGEGLDPEFKSENTLYYIDPSNPFSNNGDVSSLENLGLSQATTSITSYENGDSFMGIKLIGPLGKINVTEIQNIRTVSIFCKFPSIYTNRYYLLDARTGNSQGYITTQGLQIGSLWNNCKVYINGGIQSRLIQNTLNMVMSPDDTFRQITLVANESFSDDITFFNRYELNEGTDVEFGIIKMFDQELTEEENTRVFLQHSKYYDNLILRDEVRDGLVYYIDPMNPNCYTENTLTMTNLYGEDVSTTLTGNTGDYSLDTSEFALELVDKLTNGIQVDTISNLRTISMWVKISSTDTGGTYLLDARPGDGQGYFLRYYDDPDSGTLWTGCNYYLNGISGTIDSQAILTILDRNDSWRHIVLIANRDFTDDVTLLSRYTGLNETTLCKVGPVKIFNRVLNEEEILSLYNEFASRFNQPILYPS
jgi:hypothetical protein